MFMELFQLAITLFFSLLLQSLPSLLLGILISSALLIWSNTQKMVRLLPSNALLGALVGSSLGFMFPVGQYGIIPLTRRLLLEGVSSAVAWSFLVAGPVLNIVTILLSWHIWSNQPRLIFIRLLGSWLMALFIGLVWSLVDSSLINNKILPLEVIENSQEEVSIVNKLPLFWSNMISEVRELVSVLVIGCALASIVLLLLPAQYNILSPTQSPLLQTLGMIALSGIFSLDTWMSPPVVASFSQSFLESSKFAFFFFSPVNLVSLCLLFNIFRPKLVIYFLTIIFLFSLLSGLAINFIK